MLFSGVFRQPAKPIRSRPLRCMRIFANCLMISVTLLGAAALYYSTIQPEWLLILVTASYAAINLIAVFAVSRSFGIVIWAIATTGLVIWYTQDPPRNDRNWATEYAIPATFSQIGDTVTLKNIRDFTYRSETDFTPHYYNAIFQLDQLNTVDLVSSYWAGDSIAHIFLTFGFADGRHVAISIETRRQKRFAYSTLAGFFHHFELFYVVADERDLIGVRTDIRHERVYLYRLQIAPATAQALFLNYMNEINRLAQHPQWYNTLTDNCTTGILSRAPALADAKFNWRIVLSGYAPLYAYDHGLLNTSMSFPELKARSLIVRPPDATISASYSDDIRASLPLANAKAGS